MDSAQLTEIEEIKKLKARYFRLMDQKRWDEWAGLFAEDFTGIYRGPHPELHYQGRSDFVSRTTAALVNAVTVHHGHTPEIELTSPTTATGIWAMYDYVQTPEFTLHGYGHYEEQYVKDHGVWRFQSIKLTRLRTDVGPGTQTEAAPA
ncbi:MAG: nuclear transport factor 2 family protein [Candidatus Binatia bacterium]